MGDDPVSDNTVGVWAILCGAAILLAAMFLFRNGCDESRLETCGGACARSGAQMASWDGTRGCVCGPANHDAGP